MAGLKQDLKKYCFATNGNETICDEEREEYQWIEINGITFKKCPYHSVEKTPEVYEILKFYRFYKDGFLPATGSIEDQAGPLMDYFDLLNQVMVDKHGTE